MSIWLHDLFSGGEGRYSTLVSPRFHTRVQSADDEVALHSDVRQLDAKVAKILDWITHQERAPCQLHVRVMDWVWKLCIAKEPRSSTTDADCRCSFLDCATCDRWRLNLATTCFAPPARPRRLEPFRCEGSFWLTWCFLGSWRELSCLMHFGNRSS